MNKTINELFEHEIELANAENRTVIIFAYEDVFYVSMWMKIGGRIWLNMIDGAQESKMHENFKPDLE